MRVCPTCGDDDLSPKGECYACRAARERERYWANPEPKRAAVREYYRATKVPCPVCGAPKRPDSVHCRECSEVLRYYE